MFSFTFNLVSESPDGRVPAAVAGQIMVDVQRLFSHIGEHLVARELRIQGRAEPRLMRKFDLYVDSSGGISVDTSTSAPETSGRGCILEDAAELMERTLDAAGSDGGCRWMEEAFGDPVRRNRIILDVAALCGDVRSGDGCALMYGSGGKLKRLGDVDADGLARFVEERGLVANGATVGILRSTPTKSRGRILSLEHAGGTVKLEFADTAGEMAARLLVDRGPVALAGRMRFDGDGRLAEITNAGGAAPLTSIRFRRAVSSTGDVALSTPVEARVSWSDGMWTLRNDELGISVAKPGWDSAVQQFHDYFVFLWTQYAARPPDGLSGEEAEVRDALLALVAPAPSA